MKRLWFDVGIKRYTTRTSSEPFFLVLWFDVGIKRYTTTSANKVSSCMLWFDVGIKRYTTYLKMLVYQSCCGLM